MDSNNTDFYQYLSNKSVAIIGNAQSLFDWDWSEEINKYDVVVRMNKGTNLTPEQLKKTTNRCDVYCASGFGCITDGKWTTNYPLYNIWMTTYSRNRAPKNFLFYPTCWWTELYVSLGEFRPTTGFMVIDMIRRTDPCNIGVFGFDFWETKTFYNQEVWTPKSYTPTEKDKILEMFKNDNRFHHYTGKI